MRALWGLAHACLLGQVLWWLGPAQVWDTATGARCLVGLG